MLDVVRRPWTVFPLAIAFALAALAAAPAPVDAQVAGQNVNMVSGTGWPGGDPFLQRQNEPSLAVSTRNPAHLLAGANDYRTVDIPNAEGNEVGDAWLGVFKSFDGGQTWQSTLLPGYPQDTSAVGAASPIKGYKAAADPVIRAGTDGLFYYGGITFNRGSNLGQVFVSRFMDLNDRENGSAAATTTSDPIRYVDTAVIDTGTSGQFLDKPWLAVDIPRGGGKSCSIPVSPTQTVAAGNVYLAYAKFTGSNTSNSQVLFVRSLDCGKTWSKPLKISPNDHKNQGTAVAIDPATGAIYVAYRRFETNSSNPDAIVVVQSTDFGKSFGPGVDAALVEPFDQNPTTPTRFRTASLPVIAVSVVGDPGSTSSLRRVHVAWAERDAPFGQSRIVVKTSLDGVTWPADTAKVAVDADPLSSDLCPGCYAEGHQFMPSLTFTEGRLMALYYDQRLDQTLGRLKPNDPFEPAPQAAPNAGSFFTTKRKFLGDQGWFTPTIDDYGLTSIRHLLDLRVAQATLSADPGAPLAFTSAAVSQYKYGTLPGSNTPQPSEEDLDLDQLEVNPPNLPMFSKGTLPFIGDYIEIAGLSFVPTPSGGWQFNTGWRPAGQPQPSPVHYAVWTSNQDVVPPPDNDWTRYTPPTLPAALLAQLGPNSLVDGTPRPSCSVFGDGPNGWAGTRNQNIYFSRVTEGLGVWSPQNAKPLDTDRAFVVIVQNATLSEKTVVLGLPTAGVSASFERQASTPGIWVRIPPLSSITRSVFVKANANTGASFAVKVDEAAPDSCNSPADTSGCLLQGASAVLQLNAPGSFGATLASPGGSGPLGPESYAVSLSSAAVTSPNLAAVTSAAVTSAAVTSAAVTSAAVTSQALAAPQLAAVTSAAVTSAAVTSYNISDAAVTSAAVTSAAVTSAAVTSAAVTSGNILAAVTSAPLSDANYTLKNEGNTTHSYHVKLVGTLPQCPTATGGTTNCPVQLILSKPYGSPYANGCELAQDYRPVSVVNVDDVSGAVVNDPGQIADPGIPDPNPTNATITLGPGETGVITLRGPLDLLAMQAAAGSLVPVVVPHAGTGYAAPLLITGNGPGLATPQLGVPYSAALATALGVIGGQQPYSWVSAGSLPAGLTLTPGGTLVGTPTQAGSTTATITVSDAAGASAQTSLTLTVAPGGSATTLAVAPASPVFGSPVALTVTVTTPAASGLASPGGTVTFKDGSVELGSQPLSGTNGTWSAQLVLASLPAGPHSFTAAYSGDTNYAGSSTAQALAVTVAPALPTIAVSGGTFTYDGQEHPATAVVTGVGGGAVTGLLSLTYSPGGTFAPRNAGSYGVTASFVSQDPNYASGSATGSIRIDPATPAVAVSGGPFAYNGLPHGASATATGVGGVAVPGNATFSYSPGGSTTPVAAGTYAVVAAFTSSDPNYGTATGSGSITIGAASPVVTVTGGTFTYDGKAHAATATATGVGNTIVAGSFTYTYNGTPAPPTNAGTYAVVATFSSSSGNYGGATGAGTVVINPATPTVAVVGGTFVYDGAAHPASATATGVGGVTVPGSVALSYSPGDAAAPVAVGSYGVTAAFSSASANYTNAVGGGSVVVNRANSTTTVSTSQSTTGLGAQVTFTASVAPSAALAPGTARPTGTVTFKDGTATLGTGTLGTAGTATFSTSMLSAGAHSITAVYAGDATFNGSTSATLTQTVKAPYAFTGFDTPLVAAGTLAAPTNAGTWSYSRVLPIKWALKDSTGKNVTALSSTKVLAAWFAGATCSATATPPPMPDPVPTDPKLLPAGLVILYSPTAGAAGGSTFRSGSSGFNFNWDATKGSKGPGCYWIRLQLDDASPEKVTKVLLN